MASVSKQRGDIMFPIMLDGAEVLYHTPQDHFGSVRYPDGKISDDIRYLAICRYKDDEDYYLFCCDEKLEVVSDSLWHSIDECMKVASASYEKNISWHKSIR